MVRSFCALQRRSSALLLVRGCFGVMGITSYSPSCANPVLNTSSRTRYGRIISFLNSRVSEQNWQFRAYIPTVGVSLMPRDMPMKWIFWHLSHIMPMWIGMAQITAWTAFFLCGSPDPRQHGSYYASGRLSCDNGPTLFPMQRFLNCRDGVHSGCVAAFWRVYEQIFFAKREGYPCAPVTAASGLVVEWEVGRPYLARVTPSCQFPSTPSVFASDPYD
jgi:hypothetical protein